MANEDSPATKHDLNVLRKDLLEFMEGSKEDVMRHFDLTVETIRHDLLGANRDDIGVLKDAKNDHEKRIRKLERATGTIAV